MALAAQLKPFSAEELDGIGFDQAEASELFETGQDGFEVAPGGSEAKRGGKPQVSVRLMIAVANVEVVERALSATGQMNREQALLEVCNAYLNGKSPDADGQLGSPNDGHRQLDPH